MPEKSNQESPAKNKSFKNPYFLCDHSSARKNFFAQKKGPRQPIYNNPSILNKGGAIQAPLF